MYFLKCIYVFLLLLSVTSFCTQTFPWTLRYIMKIEVHSMKKISPSPFPLLPGWAMTSDVVVQSCFFCLFGLVWFWQSGSGFWVCIFKNVYKCCFFYSFAPNPVFCLDLQISNVIQRPRYRSVINLFSSPHSWCSWAVIQYFRLAFLVLRFLMGNGLFQQDM